MDVKRLPRDHALRRIHFLDLEQEAFLSGRLVHQLNHQRKVGHQGLIVALQVGGRLHQVCPRLQVALYTGVAPLAAVVVRRDQAGGSRDQRHHRVAVCRVLHHEPRAARVERPRPGRGQDIPRLQRAQVHRIAARDPAYRKPEVGRTAAAAADRGRLHRVHARRQFALHSRVEASAAVVVVCQPASVLGEQIEERVSIRGGQVDPYPSGLGHLEAVGVSIAQRPEAGVAVLRAPPPVDRQIGPRVGAQRAQVGRFAPRRILRPGGAAPAQNQETHRQGGQCDRHRQQAYSRANRRHDEPLNVCPLLLRHEILLNARGCCD